MTTFFFLRPSQIRSILGHNCLSCQKTPKKLNKCITPPPKTEPQNESLEDDFPLQTVDFQIPCEFSGVQLIVDTFHVAVVAWPLARCTL